MVPDPDPNYLQKLSADDTSRQRVNVEPLRPILNIARKEFIQLFSKRVGLQIHPRHARVQRGWGG